MGTDEKAQIKSNKRQSKRNKLKRKGNKAKAKAKVENVGANPEGSKKLSEYTIKKVVKRAITKRKKVKKEKAAKELEEELKIRDTEVKDKCYNYLNQWSNDKDNWKFNKKMQAWLKSKMYDNKLITEEYFPMALEYFNAAQGNIRKKILEEAEKIVNIEEEENSRKDRARQIVQSIQET